MGHWALPDTSSDARMLSNLVAQGIPAGTACEVLYDLIGSDLLFDRLDKIAKKSPATDVAPLVSNAIAEIYFTGTDPREFASEAAIEILRGIADVGSTDQQDAFFSITKIKNEVRALDRFAHWLEIDRADCPDWSVSRDPNGQDFIARNAKGPCSA